MNNTNVHNFERFGKELVSQCLAGSPVVFVIGPLGSGKSTIVKEFRSGERRYISLDDDNLLESARYDPAGFVRELEFVIIDEMQRAPEILLAIKQAVEDDGRPGRFLLTSSADLALLQELPESLAERMEIITLLPLSRAEIEGSRPSFVATAFSGELIEPPFKLIAGELVETVIAGGYPDMLRRKESGRRGWVRAYIDELVQRNVREIAGVGKVEQFHRLLEVLAIDSGQLANFSRIGSQLDLDDKTAQKYVGILEQLFLVQRVPAWFESKLSRLVKTPKLHFLDSGLQAAMLGLSAGKVATNRAAYRALLGTFVFSEIMKQIHWSEEIYTLNHYRDKDQDEVNFLVEDESGALIGIDVKPAATVFGADFKGLRKVQSNCGDKLKLGVVLYDGTRTVAFGDRLFAAPISCLWGRESAGEV